MALTDPDWYKLVLYFYIELLWLKLTLIDWRWFWYWKTFIFIDWFRFAQNITTLQLVALACILWHWLAFTYWYREPATHQNARPFGWSTAERQCLDCLDIRPCNCKQTPSFWSPIQRLNHSFLFALPRAWVPPPKTTKFICCSPRLLCRDLKLRNLIIELQSCYNLTQVLKFMSNKVLAPKMIFQFSKTVKFAGNFAHTHTHTHTHKIMNNVC